MSGKEKEMDPLTNSTNLRILQGFVFIETETVFYYSNPNCLSLWNLKICPSLHLVVAVIYCKFWLCACLRTCPCLFLILSVLCNVCAPLQCVVHQEVTGQCFVPLCLTLECTEPL